MAISLALRVSPKIKTDGTATSFSFDLLNDAYALSNANEANWPPGRRGALPVSVDVVGSPLGTATISGSVVTVTFAAAPAADTFDVNLNLIF